MESQFQLIALVIPLALCIHWWGFGQLVFHSPGKAGCYPTKTAILLQWTMTPALPGLYIEVQGLCCGHPFRKFPNAIQSPSSSFNGFSARNQSPSWVRTSQISWCVSQSHVLLLPITRCGSCAVVQYPSCTLPIETGRLLLCSLPAGDSRCAWIHIYLS